MTLQTLADFGDDPFTTKVRYELKTSWRNGTTYVIFEPWDFMYRMYGMPRAQGEVDFSLHRANGATTC